MRSALPSARFTARQREECAAHAPHARRALHSLRDRGDIGANCWCAGGRDAAAIGDVPWLWQHFAGAPCAALDGRWPRRAAAGAVRRLPARGLLACPACGRPLHAAGRIARLRGPRFRPARQRHARGDGGVPVGAPVQSLQGRAQPVRVLRSAPRRRALRWADFFSPAEGEAEALVTLSCFGASRVGRAAAAARLRVGARRRRRLRRVRGVVQRRLRRRALQLPRRACGFCGGGAAGGRRTPVAATRSSPPPPSAWRWRRSDAAASASRIRWSRSPPRRRGVRHLGGDAARRRRARAPNYGTAAAPTGGRVRAVLVTAALG